MSQLLRLLPAIVRLVEHDTDMSADQLEILLMASGLEADERYVRELGIWVRLLARARDAAATDMADAVVEGLIVRGIPEDQARGAVISLRKPEGHEADTQNVEAAAGTLSPEVALGDPEERLMRPGDSLADGQMSQPRWTITKDYIADKDAPEGTNANAVGVQGPLSRVTTPHDPNITKFRMYDDDDELIYEGVYGPLSSDDEFFAPLDDFGEPNVGCTYIKYYNEKMKVWEVL